MSLFNFVDTFFFISLGITFVLILLLVQHFKSRLQILETKCDTMFDILNTMTVELKNIKQEMISNRNPEENYISSNNYSFPESNMMNSLFQNLGVGMGINEIIQQMRVDMPYNEYDSTNNMEPEKIHISEDNEENIKVINLDLDDLDITNMETKYETDSEQKQEINADEGDDESHEFRPKYSEEDLKKMNVEQLREIAIELGVHDVAKLKKKELVSILITQFAIANE